MNFFRILCDRVRRSVTQIRWFWSSVLSQQRRWRIVAVFGIWSFRFARFEQGFAPDVFLEIAALLIVDAFIARVTVLLATGQHRTWLNTCCAVAYILASILMLVDVEGFRSVSGSISMERAVGTVLEESSRAVIAGRRLFSKYSSTRA